jgi:quercetin dioxygenase-like cupin family protein
MLKLSSSRSCPAAVFALGLLLLSGAALAQTAPPPPADAHGATQMILQTGKTVTDEPIQYPAGNPKITAVEITLAPGQQTGWHTHPVPLFGYILEGELTVDYGPLGKRIYRQGEALVEAMNEAHNGYSSGSGPVKILAVFVGAEGTPDTTRASPPVREK